MGHLIPSEQDGIHVHVWTVYRFLLLNGFHDMVVLFHCFVHTWLYAGLTNVRLRYEYGQKVFLWKREELWFTMHVAIQVIVLVLFSELPTCTAQHCTCTCTCTLYTNCQVLQNSWGVKTLWISRFLLIKYFMRVKHLMPPCIYPSSLCPFILTHRTSKKNFTLENFQLWVRYASDSAYIHVHVQCV